MPITINLKAKGLYTNPNPLDLQEGAMVIADNCIIDRDSTIEQRRGFSRYGTAITGTMKKLIEYKETLLLNYDTTLAYDSDGAGTWVDYVGTYTPPTGSARIITKESNKNLYILTNAGVKKLDDVTSTITDAGAPKALDGSAATNGTSGWMTDDTQAAYRIVWGITDANMNKILGSPSQRINIINTTGSAVDVDITFTIPETITTTYFYQIYRSGLSVDANTEANDEMQLVVEKNPTAGEITAGEITYTDMTPDSLRGASLYTSPSQQGILQANEQPPLARDMDSYKQMMLYANTIAKQRLNITLISVGATAGIQNDDTITIDGVVYTGKGTETASSGYFLVDTSGTAAENIDSTARSLVHVINMYSANTTVYAYYLSGYADLPGQILIEERGIGGSQFVATSSRGGAFNPELPISGTTYASANDVAKNRIYISKPGQPEAVPILQYVECGSANKDILRIIALRDSFFILKEDGVYRGIGEDPTTVRVFLFDNTTELLSIDSAAAFNNQIFAYTTQGITAISDSGVSIISRPIESSLLQVSSEQYTYFTSVTHGTAYESNRKYILSTVSEETDTYSTQQYVYNSLTNTFTRWTLNSYHSLVKSSDNKLYYCNADSAVPYVMKERKTFTNTDYSDDDLALSIVGQSGLTLEVVSSANATVGWTLSDGIRTSVITDIPDTTHIVVTDYLTWTISGLPVRCYKPITTIVKWAPQYAANPTMVKHFSDLLMQFRDATFNSIDLTFNSDLSGYDETITMYPSVSGSWGYFPWGYPAWGGKDTFLQTMRTFIPINKSRARWINFEITHEQAYSNFAVAGVSMNYRDISVRTK